MPVRQFQRYQLFTAEAMLLPVVFFAISLAMAACTAQPRPHVVVYEDPRGSIYLEAIPDGSFHATHPILLDPAVIAQVLRGIRVQEQQRILQTLVTGAPKPVRAFSDEDTTFLARHIVTAFSQATARQRVGFRVFISTETGTETTGGTLFFTDGHSLHISLTHFRYNPEKPSPDSKPGRQLPDPTGLAQRRMLFSPESVQLPAEGGPSAWLGENPQVSVVVDYDALTRMSEAPHSPTTLLPQGDLPPQNLEQGASHGGQYELPSATSDELQSMRALIEKQAKELEALKDEVETLRRHRPDAEKTPLKSKAEKQPTSRMTGPAP